MNDLFNFRIINNVVRFTKFTTNSVYIENHYSLLVIQFIKNPDHKIAVIRAKYKCLGFLNFFPDCLAAILKIGGDLRDSFIV